MFGFVVALGSSIPTVEDSVHYIAQPIHLIERVHAQEPETIEAQITRIAKDAGISSTTLYNLVESESQFNPLATSSSGDYGIVQINLEQPPILEKNQPPITKEQVFDTEWSLRFAAKAIAMGKQDAWTACNCYAQARAILGSLPKMADIKPNSTPRKNGLIIFNYSGVKHIAVITGFSKTGNALVREANLKPCLTGSREVFLNDPAIIGFWSASP